MAWRIRQAGYADLEEAAQTKAWSWVESLDELLPQDALRRQLDPERISHTVTFWREVLDDGGYLWVVVGDQAEIEGVAQVFSRQIRHENIQLAGLT